MTRDFFWVSPLQEEEGYHGDGKIEFPDEEEGDGGRKQAKVLVSIFRIRQEAFIQSPQEESKVRFPNEMIRSPAVQE